MPPRRHELREWREVAPDAGSLPDVPYPDEPSPNGTRPPALPGFAARILPGGIILDEPETPPAVWGDGDEILWAEGESLIIAGPDGVGKTTVAGCLIRARLGLGAGEDGVCRVLGRPVAPGKRNVLLLSMDRPRQARRALRRLFSAADRDILDERLRIWQGPPPADLARNVLMLTELAALADADTVIIDSLKDAALKLADDETGSGWNRARQMCIEAGAELIELHHPRKAQADNRKPSKLEDLYGSRWITGGAGSVISLWGEAGDVVVEFSHLKPPAALCAPFMMGIDPAAGTVHVDQPAVDLVAQIRQRGSNGMTAEVGARLIFGADRPTRSQIEKARYRLDKKVAGGVLYRRDGTRGGVAGGEPATWFLAASDQETGAGERSEKRSESDQTLQDAKRSETGGDSSPLFPDRSWPEGSIGEAAQ